MRIDVVAPDFAALTHGIEGGIAKVATAAMRESTPIALEEYRRQVRNSGLGGRLANTWRGKIYPLNRDSIEAAGYIYSNAPDIVDAFARGATIRPVNGAKYLWIPTKNVPRATGRRGSTQRMTPDQVESTFNTDLIIRPGRDGHLLAFIPTVMSRSGRGLRAATPRRKAAGRQPQMTLMFTLVASAHLPQLLDLPGPAQRWAADYANRLERGLDTI